MPAWQDKNRCFALFDDNRSGYLLSRGEGRANGFVHSSLAYQGHARRLGRDRVYAANTEALDGLLPDAVVLLDLEPGQAMERARARSTLDRIEAEDMAFHQAVRTGFLAEASDDPERFIVVAAGGDPEGIHQTIVEELESRA